MHKWQMIKASRSFKSIEKVRGSAYRDRLALTSQIDLLQVPACNTELYCSQLKFPIPHKTKAVSFDSPIATEGYTTSSVHSGDRAILYFQQQAGNAIPPDDDKHLIGDTLHS